MTKILGIDIGAKFVVAFLLDGLPSGMSYPDWYRKHAKTCLYKIRVDNKDEGSSIKIKDAIELLQKLQPDAIVLEPTGVWYSKLWAKLGEHLGIEVKWIGHSDLAGNRKAYGFEDKDDRLDAFCLAVSGFHPDFNSLNKWLNWRAGLIADVNDRVLELESVRSTTTIFTQQLRQRLKFEFPEIADRTISNCVTPDGFTAWVGWLAGIHNYKRIENERAKSIATELSIDISKYTRDHAAALAGNQIRSAQLTKELAELLLDPAFDKYVPTLELFGFGTKMQGVVLSQIYPFEKFLRDGKPYIDRWQDDVKWHKRNKSLSGFQISMGMGKRWIKSGSSEKEVYSGSGFTRSKLYTWVMKYVIAERMADSWLVQEIDRRALSNSPPALTIAQLRKRWKTTKGSNSDRHKAGAGVAMAVSYRVTRLLYDHLLKAVSS